MSNKRRGPESKYTDAFKRQLVGESYVAGSTVPMVSRLHEVPTSRIYSWRGDARYQPAGDAFALCITGRKSRKTTIKYDKRRYKHATLKRRYLKQFERGQSLKRCSDIQRKDDVLVVTKLDRLARSTAELLRISEALNEKGAGIQSLDEPWADTTTPAGKMIMTVFGGIA